MPDRLLEAHEVAELLAVPVSWVRSETHADRLRHLTPLPTLRPEAVLAWLEGQRAGQWRKWRPGPHLDGATPAVVVL